MPATAATAKLRIASVPPPVRLTIPISQPGIGRDWSA
jgi:hypothetical protein